MATRIKDFLVDPERELFSGDLDEDEALYKAKGKESAQKALDVSA